MCDALNFLNKYYEDETKKKTVLDLDDPIQITDTERFLFNLFKGNISAKHITCSVYRQRWKILLPLISLMETYAKN